MILEILAQTGHEEVVVRHNKDAGLKAIILAGAMRQGERLRRAIQDAVLPHPATPQGVVTISVGVASAAPHADFGAELLIAAADAALYRAKGAGKNRIEAAGQP